jgi:5-methylcytosine-specific restriction endonuclease McrA
MKCKTCGKNAESEYCFLHKPRKALRKTVILEKNVKKSSNSGKKSDLHEFFLHIWKNRQKHDCENCGKWLGKEPLSYMFDHLLEKSKYPDLAKEEDNIMLVCLECHDNKTRGFLTDFVRQKILELRKKYNK